MSTSVLETSHQQHQHNMGQQHFSTSANELLRPRSKTEVAHSLSSPSSGHNAPMSIETLDVRRLDIKRPMSIREEARLPGGGGGQEQQQQPIQQNPNTRRR